MSPEQPIFQSNLYKLAAWACLVAVILTGVWMTLIGSIPNFPGRANILLYARVIAMDPFPWSQTFYITFINTMVQVPILLGLYYLIRGQMPVRALLSLVYGMIYVPLSAISQFFQLTVVPRSAAAMMLPDTERVKAAQLAQSGGWNFLNTQGPGYALEVLAATFLSIALLLCGSALAQYPGLKRACGTVMVLASAFQLIGVTGYMLGNESLAIVMSGFDISVVVLYPLLMVVMLRSARF